MDNSFQNIYDKIVSQTHTKMLGIGKNYPSTIDPSVNQFPSTPIVFLKSMDSIIKNPTEINLPKHDCSIIHEIELGFMISKEAKEIEESKWEDYIAGYFLVFDFTEKEMLADVRQKGFPWTLCKGQPGFCPVSEFLDKSLINNPHNLDLQFSLNGKQVLTGNTSQMHFNIPQLLKYITSLITLNPGDMVITGTPVDGLGVIQEKDQVEGVMKQNGQVIAKIAFSVKK